MCGIFGAINFNIPSAASLHKLKYRGPDDFGEYFEENKQIYLGHHRLSIIDLSKAGHQPMSLDDKSAYITYNGEVYNFEYIKSRYFSKSIFKSKTDTEVILHLYNKFQVRTPEYLRGMFAFGIYNKNKNEIFLTRDRIGIKPLFYYHKENRFAFSSEINALKGLPNINLEIDPVGLDYYFNYGYIPAPFTAYKHIKKIKPAHRLVYNISTNKITLSEPYWKLRNSIDSLLYTTENEWLTAIEEKIKESIKIRLVSDVPLGAFLSGGIDSSLVVSFMAGLVEKPIKTFTIGFDYQKFDERSYAKSVADQYCTEHHVEVVRPQALDVLPKLSESFGEPFSDPSAIPTYYLAKIAKKYVTVALSGDGGDEVFTGYTRYKRMHHYEYLNSIPIQMRKMVKYIGKFLPQYIPGYGFLQRQAYNNVRLFHEMNCSFTNYDLEKLYTIEFKNLLIKEENDYYKKILDEQNGFENDFITQLQIIDLNSYLPEDVLTKVDRMSMLHSLEARVPLLDHELIELAFSCPASIRFKEKKLKYILKKILADKVSPHVLDHKKQGFGIPLSHWFRSDLKEYMISILDNNKSNHFINYNYVKDIFDLHLRGGRDFSKNLYSVLMFNYWQNILD
jgi:asparagine synthase (glutamine-hydrolysing)